MTARFGGERNASWLAAAAALVASLGDLMMLAVANAGRPELALAAPPDAWLVAGGALGVVAIPWYALGYCAAGRIAARASGSSTRWFAWIGVAVGLIGACIHGLTARSIHLDRLSGAAPQDPFAAVLGWGLPIVALWLVATALVLAGSIEFARRVRRARSPRVRALALANPALATVVLALPGLVSIVWASFLSVAAPNLAHLLFFAACGAAAGRVEAAE